MTQSDERCATCGERHISYAHPFTPAVPPPAEQAELELTCRCGCNVYEHGEEYGQEHRYGCRCFMSQRGVFWSEIERLRLATRTPQPAGEHGAVVNCGIPCRVCGGTEYVCVDGVKPSTDTP